MTKLLTGDELSPIPDIERLAGLMTLPVAINSYDGTAVTARLRDINAIALMTSGSANTFTIPAEGTAEIENGAPAPESGARPGTGYSIVQFGAGATTIVAASGVTINGLAGSLAISGQYGMATLIKIATNEYLAFGNLG
jgi:hypothetical protein